MKKTRIAQRARSFKEDFLDALSTLRSPSQSNSPQTNGNPRNHVFSASPVRSVEKSPSARQIVSRLDEDFAAVGLGEQLAKEIRGNTVKITCALKYFQDAVAKNKLEMLPGSASVILESVSHMLSTLGNAAASNEHSSRLISATSLVHQALAQLIRWSDEVLLSSPANDSSENVLREEVGPVVEGLQNALYDLVQLVIHKITNRTPPPPTASPLTSPAATSLKVNEQFFHCTPSSPARLSKSSDGSFLDEIRSSDWSSDSFTDDCETAVAPPKPPLPLKGIWTESSRSYCTARDSSPPPPLPPKKRSLAAAGAAKPGQLNSGWATPTLPDLVPHQSWITGSLDSLSLGCSASEVFHQRTDMGLADQRNSANATTDSGFTFSSSSSSSFTSSFLLTTYNSRLAEALGSDDNVVVLSVPPALPVKRRQRLKRTPSQYDNVDQTDAAFSNEQMSNFRSSDQEIFTESTSTNIRVHHELSGLLQHHVTSSAPPLPPKKRNIMAYMEMVGQYSQPKAAEIFRQSMEAYNSLAADWQARNEDLFIARASSYLTNPPLLPPKKSRSTNAVTSQSSSSQSETTGDREATPTVNYDAEIPATTSAELIEVEGMEKLELRNELNIQNPEDEGHEVRGGTVDALILHATKLNKDDFMYQEAFLATYRTFISPIELVRKLVKRFHCFLRKIDITFQRAARNAFSLLVRVVDDLALSELEPVLLREIIEFQSYLVSSGDLVLARALRTKLLEKCAARRKKTDLFPYLPSIGISTKLNTLLDFRSAELAEQMTLLDAELFHRIEVPEVLLWAQEQNEEKTTNLNLFTEHFNKMSYWARSRILEQTEARERERYVTKFIKVMKHLRRLNNFNSYLALLSALDSAPVRRLEWQKSITDGLQEYCALIDSSSSFRAYRQALAETQPPCIPYIGLILQDLTFVHIGNPDLLPDGRINFAKRWQQFHILENMRRFQKCQYQFKRNEKIILFFNDFSDSLSEETMWSISESIRPRGTNNNSTKK